MAQQLNYHDQVVPVGATVRVHQEIMEGNKKRVQVFEGVVMAIQNAGSGKSFTVRKLGAGGISVEKIFPANLPSIKKIEVKRVGQVRRAKLYYLRDKIGRKATRIKEKSLYRSAESAS